jgi:hypothetical protein
MTINPAGIYQTISCNFFQIHCEGNIIVCMYLVMVDLHKHKQDVELVLFCLYLLRPYFFLTCKANARVKFAKMVHGPHSSTLVVICVVRLLFVLFCVLFVCKCVLVPGDNPIAVNKYII